MTRMIALLATLGCAAPQDFDAVFTGKTMRFDYYHSGTATEEQISLDQLRLEQDWPGSRTHLLDPTNLGKFLLLVVDAATNVPIYSRGFASIYGEWETIGEARAGIWRSFHESQRFPEPRSRFQLVLKKRDKTGSFREIYSTALDPESRFVNRSPLNARGTVWSVIKNGPPSRKVDLLVLGDGYTEDELPRFREDVKRLADALFASEPFRSQREQFNVWAVDTPSERSGITRPRDGIWNETPFGLSFNAFDSERYVLTYRNRELREIAALAPYDTIVLLANTRKYGGGGIFNLWATCAAGSSQANYLFVHEFGHSFAGLADEYYTSQVAYEEFNPPGVEPWEPNITALLDPERLKWKDLVEATTPLPTPWRQEEYDRASHEYQRKRQEMRAAKAPEEEMEKLFAEVKATTTPILNEAEYAGRVGAFEGAGYQAKGLYRSEMDCIMFTRNPDSFCKVCARAIERTIRLYTE